ncbi:MAG: DNA helicase II [Betaproteobacteria bacterium TMED156]|nr:MAG: DNA helicase II [Betaproteobacteria bacterium TMED156]
MKYDLLNGLNEQQKAAVTAENSSVLVLAGAGSGKTRVLTTRIAWLLAMGKANPREIMAVTFTNKAARELMTRISAMLTFNLGGMWIGTFHGLCNRMLRFNYQQAALPENFQILDIQDQLAAIKRLMKNLNVDTEKFAPRQVQRFINSAKEEGLRFNNIEENSEFNKLHIELYEAYEIQCQKEGVVDFGELLLRSLELLQRSKDIREHYQLRFKHILVDEFQDTSSLQYEWLKLLSNKSTNVLAVGDDDQSIYAFRGADVANMKYFKKDFNVRDTVRLEQNYRSHGYILDAANALISNNSSRLGKNLWTDLGMGELIKTYESLEDIDEAIWIVEEAKSFIDLGLSPSEIAILYRSNAQSRIIEHELNKRKLDYRVYGGLRFYDRAEVKHALAYLRLIENQDDNNAFLRIVNFPPRKIGSRTIDKLQETAEKFNVGLFKAIEKIDGKSGAALFKFKELILGITNDVVLMNLPETVNNVITRSGLVEHFLSEKNGSERLENLKELVTASSGFIDDENISSSTPSNYGLTEENSNDQIFSGKEGVLDDKNFDLDLNLTPLARFLSHASLESGEAQAAAGKEAVQLMTIHSAKGLEFDVVFVTGLEEGLFPHENSLNEFNGLEEERRLMYVALTRARKRLFLTSAQSRRLHGQLRYHQKSRFLSEIPEKCIKKIQSFKNKSHNFYTNQNQNLHSIRLNNFSTSYGSEPNHNNKENSLKIGQNIRHKRFGDGVVIAIQGTGLEASAQIQFEGNDIRCLSLAVAKFEKI